MGREGEHMQLICVVVVAADTLHQLYNNQNGDKQAQQFADALCL
jgi:hypothetical protein